MANATDRCWKGRKHDYEEEFRTKSHIVKKCTQCKGKKWTLRRTVNIDVATAMVY